MATEFITLDRLTMVAPLGLRFHDASTGRLIGDGLVVWAYPLGRPNSRRRATANRKGTYVLHRGDGDFVIEVNDEQRRFQPFRFTTSLPVEGIFKWDVALASPLAEMSTIPLFSSPLRTVPSAMAAIRADLWDTSIDAPAAWAMIEVFTAGKFIGVGIADEAGRIAVIFPYPTPLSFVPASPPESPLVSPPVATSPPITEQVWPLELRALYTPQRPVPSPPDLVGGAQALPDLRFTLSQPAATLWADAEQTEILEDTNLRFGRELILKSRPPLASPLSSRRDSVLFITPAV